MTARPSRLILAIALVLAAPTRGEELFPEPFAVRHQLRQHDRSGEVTTSPPVVDYYGGSWIVSVREDGSRRVLDLSRGEVLEIRPAAGRYSVVGVDRLGEVISRLRVLEEGAPGDAVEDPTTTKALEAGSAGVPPAPGSAGSAGVPPAPEARAWTVRAASSAAAPPLLSTSSLPAAARALVDRPGVEHLVVSAAADASTDRVEVWVDPSRRLRPAALAALSRFERALAAHDGPDGSALDAARRHAAGALPVRTVRVDGGITVEDVTLSVEALERFPAELALVPEGLERRPHPLEELLAWRERDDAALAGRLPGTPEGGR